MEKYNPSDIFTSREKHIVNISLFGLIIFTSWHSDLIEIRILNQSNNCQYTGIIMIEDIKNSAEDLEIPFEQFYKELKEALITAGGLENFEYTIQNNTFMIQKNETFKMTYLESLISETTENLKDFLINEAININNSLEENLSRLQRKSEKDNLDYKQLEKTCKQVIEEKNSLEMNLLSKFVVLLNSKKDKISQLQEDIAKNNITNKSKVTDYSANDERNTDDSDENENIFNAQTQKIQTDAMQLTQEPQLKVINLPKRKLTDQPSTSKGFFLPRRTNTCSTDNSIPAVSNENSSEETQDFFKKM